MKSLRFLRCATVRFIHQHRMFQLSDLFSSSTNLKNDRHNPLTPEAANDWLKVWNPVA